MQFLLSISMLRMNHTNDVLEEFFLEMDEEFQTLENVIKNILDAIDVYDKNLNHDYS